MILQTRDQALRNVAALVKKHGFSLDEIAAASTRAKNDEAKPERNMSQIIVRILSYIGGLMVFAGIGIYTGMEWVFMSHLERVLITLGPGLIALVMMMAFAKDQRYEKAATPLLLLSAILQPTGLLVFLHEYFPPSPHPELAISFVFLILCAQQSALLSVYKRTLMALLAIVFGFTGLGALLYWLHADMAFAGVVLSFSGLCLTQRISTSQHRALTPWLFFVFGLSMVENLLTLLSPDHPNWVYVITAGVLATCVILQCVNTFKVSRPVTLFFAIVPYLAFLMAAMTRLHCPDSLALIAIGGAGCAVAYGLREGLHKGLTPILYLIFASAISVGIYDLLEKTPVDVLMIGFGALMMYVSVVLGSRMLLAVSVFSLLGYLGYFTAHYFAHVVGWALALIIFGIALMLISVKAVKLGQKITKTP